MSQQISLKKAERKAFTSIYVVKPRVGVVKFGKSRKDRLFKFNIVSFITLTFAIILGILSAKDFMAVPGWVLTARVGLVVLVGFIIAAYYLDFSRLYIYGVLVAFSPVVGEWLYTHWNASHHGFPITFGVTAGIMILIGLVAFVRFLLKNPLPTVETPSEEV